jgi:thioredoxin-dependent peroxiredoxin
VILGASPDPEAALAKFKTKQKLNFPLVGDPTRKMMEAYGIWRPKKFMGRIFPGTVRSTFLIGTGGKIEHIWDPAKAKGHAAEVLAKVKELG